MNFFQNMSIAAKISTGFISILALMAITSIIVYLSVSSITASSHWVNHTYEVIHNAESVGAAMVDMETGQRGFLITGKDEYLQPYNVGVAAFKQLITKGQKLTSDNPIQGKRWQEVYKLQSQWLEETAEPEIAARRQVTLGADAITNFKTISARLVGKSIFDDIRITLAELEKQFKQQNNTRGGRLVTLITLDLVNMETGQRGFLLSGKDISLEPYKRGQKSLRVHLEQTRNILQDGAISRADIDTLEKKIGDWSRRAAQPEIDARKEINRYPLTINDVINMMEDGKGKLYMDSIRGVLKNIVKTEEVLKKTRSDEQASSSWFTKSFSIVGTLIAIIIGSIIAFFVIRGITLPCIQPRSA